MWFYYYSILFYEGGEEISTDGLTVGSSLIDAVERLTRYYGEKGIVEFSINVLDSEDCIEFEGVCAESTILNIKRKEIAE